MYRTNRFAKGGMTKGASHAKGGIKFRVKSTGQVVELEGGEGVINKAVMSSGAKVKLNGQELTPCEAASQLNQMSGGGVPFDCNTAYERGGIVQYYDTAVSPIYPSSVPPLADAYDDIDYLQMGGALIFAKGGIVDIVDLSNLTTDEQSRALRAIGVSPNVSQTEAVARMLDQIEKQGSDWLERAIGRKISKDAGERQEDEDNQLLSDAPVREDGNEQSDGQSQGILETEEGSEGGSEESGQGGGQGESEEGGQGESQETGESEDSENGGGQGEREDGDAGTNDGQDSGEMSDEDLQDIFNEIENQSNQESEGDSNTDESQDNAQNQLDDIKKQQEQESQTDEDSDEEQEQEQEDLQEDGHNDIPDQNQINEEESWISLINKIGYRKPLNADIKIAEPMRHDVPFEFFELHPYIPLGVWFDKTYGGNPMGRFGADTCWLYDTVAMKKYLEDIPEISNDYIVDYLFRLTKVHACTGVPHYMQAQDGDIFAPTDDFAYIYKVFARQLAKVIKEYDNYPDVYLTPILDLPFADYVIRRQGLAFSTVNERLKEALKGITYKELLGHVLDAMVMMIENQKRVWTYSPGYSASVYLSSGVECVIAVDYSRIGLRAQIQLIDNDGRMEWADGEMMLSTDERPWGACISASLIMPFAEALVSLYKGFDTFRVFALGIAKRGMSLEAEKIYLQTYSQLYDNYDALIAHASYYAPLNRSTKNYKPVVEDPLRPDHRFDTRNAVIAYGLLDGALGAFLPFGQTNAWDNSAFTSGSFMHLYFMKHWMQNLRKASTLSDRDRGFIDFVSEGTEKFYNSLLENLDIRDHLEAYESFWSGGGASRLNTVKVKQSDIDILKAARDVVRGLTGSEVAKFDAEIERLTKRLSQQNAPASKSKSKVTMRLENDFSDLRSAVDFCVNHYYYTPTFIADNAKYAMYIYLGGSRYDAFVTFTHDVRNDGLFLIASLSISGLRLGNTTGLLGDTLKLPYANQTMRSTELADKLIEAMVGNTSNPQAYLDELAKTTQVKVFHPIKTVQEGVSTNYKKFTAKNVSRDILGSPSLINMVGSGILLLGKSRSRRNQDEQYYTSDIVKVGYMNYMMIYEASFLMMRKTAVRVNFRNVIDIFNSSKRTIEGYFSGTSGFGRLTPMSTNLNLYNLNPTRSSEELESAIKVYLKEYLDLYNCIDSLGENEYMVLNFKTKYRGATSFFPDKT